MFGALSKVMGVLGPMEFRGSGLGFLSFFFFAAVGQGRMEPPCGPNVQKGLNISHAPAFMVVYQRERFHSYG